MSGNYLRSCAHCSAHILTNDPTSQMVFCPKCRPICVKPFDEWAASLAKGSRGVYVQPYNAWRGLSHSENIVIARDGDLIAIQIIGLPESLQAVHVNHLAQYDATPRRHTGALS